MADLSQLGYVPEQTEASAGFKSLDAGNYPAIAVSAEVKDTASGNGKYLKVEFEIFEGKGKGRKLFTNFNLVNPNKEAERIGHEQLKGFSSSVGLPNAKTSDELLNKPVLLKVTKTKDDNYGDDDGFKNEIKSFLPYTVGQQSVPAKTEQEAGQGKPSWAQ